MPKLILLCGPAGSGKSTLAHKLVKEGYTRINQDDQGKSGHKFRFNCALENRENIVIDRMNHVKGQRDVYLAPAKAKGYNTEIIVLHESKETCLARCLKREGHPTIKDEANAHSALNTFFSKYERVQDDEADTITRIWPEGVKLSCIVSDLDGTLCQIDHRLHHVKNGNKNWKAFFDGIPDDSVNWWCADILEKLPYPIVYCSGRPDNHRKPTEEWLWEKNDLPRGQLFMRNRTDSRKDDLVKEIIYEFEIKTRYQVYFVIDDRASVVSMWRKHGLVCLACAEGDF